MSIPTRVQVTGFNRKVYIKECKSKAEARRYCQYKNDTYKLFRKHGREGYEYSCARILD